MVFKKFSSSFLLGSVLCGFTGSCIVGANNNLRGKAKSDGILQQISQGENADHDENINNQIATVEKNNNVADNNRNYGNQVRELVDSYLRQLSESADKLLEAQKKWGDPLTKNVSEVLNEAYILGVTHEMEKSGNKSEEIFRSILKSQGILTDKDDGLSLEEVLKKLTEKNTLGLKKMVSSFLNAINLPSWIPFVGRLFGYFNYGNSWLFSPLCFLISLAAIFLNSVTVKNLKERKISLLHNPGLFFDEDKAEMVAKTDYLRYNGGEGDEEKYLKTRVKEIKDEHFNELQKYREEVNDINNLVIRDQRDDDLRAIQLHSLRRWGDIFGGPLFAVLDIALKLSEHDQSAVNSAAKSINNFLEEQEETINKLKETAKTVYEGGLNQANRLKRSIYNIYKSKLWGNMYKKLNENIDTLLSKGSKWLRGRNTTLDQNLFMSSNNINVTKRGSKKTE